MDFLYDLHPIQIVAETIFVSFFGMSIGGIITEGIKKHGVIEEYANLKFIKNDKVNDWIGLNIIKWFVTKTFWKHLNKNITFTNASGPERLKAVRFEMTKAEIGHLIAFIIHASCIITLIIVKANPQLIIWVSLANLFLNFYPTLLQQRNKARIDRILNRQVI